MSIEEARANVGKTVMGWDHGNGARVALKLGRDKPEGPFKLLQITKGGMAYVEGCHLAMKPSKLFSP